MFACNPIVEVGVGRLWLRWRLFVLVAVLTVMIGMWSSVFAQNTTEQTQIAAPFSEASLQSKISIARDDVKTSPEDKAEIIELYTNALAILVAGHESEALIKDYNNQQEIAPQQVIATEKETAEVRKKLRRARADILADYEEKSVEELEVNLAKEQASSNALRELMGQYDKDRQLLDQRPALASKEISVLEQAIANAETFLISQAGEELGDLRLAGTAFRQSKLFADQQKKRALEFEIASTPARIDVLDKRQNLTATKIKQSNGLVSVLRERTGSARTDDAQLRLQDAMSEAEEFFQDHAFVRFYATKNIELAQRYLDIAQSEGNLPDVEIDIGVKLQQVRLDAIVASQILGSKRVSKAYGAHLRSLRKKQPDISNIQQQIKAREVDLQDALFQRITTQETLRIFNAAPLNLDTQKQTYDLANGPSADFSETDLEHLQRAYDSRRGYLNELASIASLRTRKLEELNDLQSKYLEEVQALCVKLDSRLLWLPSTETVGVSWPGKIALGVLQTFTPGNMGDVGKAFVNGIRSSFFLVFLSIGFLAALHTLRERLKPTMSAMTSRVGRVQEDAYKLTPLAIFDGVARAAVLVGLLVILGMIFALSGSNSDFVKALGRTCFVLAGPLFVFFCLRAWSFKGGLFDLHFRVDRQLRGRLVGNIPWLVIVISISVLLVGLTGGGLDFDSGSAALGVFGFLIGALGVAWFALKIAWSRSDVITTTSREAEGVYLRNERWFLSLAIIVPVGTAILAVFGYFETAGLLLSRFYLSFCLLIAAYVIHGLFKRTLVIAQRRLALEQARARRDRAIKERMEKAAAEERGEIAVPNLDTDSIDLETINRQSKQLINVTVFVITAGLLWALWSDIVPALSVFDDVRVWSYKDISSGNVAVDIPITLWNVIQALGIGLITWLAARNFPGFLEMFVLNRFNMAQSSRFAIVTILGYIIFIIGALVAFDKLGTQWSHLQWIVAALTFGIGFGLQAIFANFISGLIILFERPVRIGDYVTIGDISGTVARIQIRATTLLDLDNKEILIPNQELVTQQVTNWTLTNPVTRLIIKIGIAYGSDTKKAHQIMLDTIRKNPNVLNTPEPTVLFLGFGDNSLNFELRQFLRDFTQRFKVSHELHMALDAALRDANIEISFPQRDLHIRNPEAIGGVIKKIMKEPTPPPPSPPRTRKKKTS